MHLGGSKVRAGGSKRRRVYVTGPVDSSAGARGTIDFSGGNNPPRIMRLGAALPGILPT